LIILVAIFATSADTVSLVLADTLAEQYVGGYLHGWVYGFNSDNYLLPIAQARVTATNGPSVFSAASDTDGGYELFIPVGNYSVTVAEPGYVSYSAAIVVTGGSASVINFYLEESHVPVPEFRSELFSIVLALSLIVMLLPKKSREGYNQHL
jgi:hypothetical protein